MAFSKKKRNLPIFIISFNRAEWLQKVIHSYFAQNYNIDIIIHDNGSDCPNTLKYLSKLENSGIVVHRNEKITNPDQLVNVNNSIAKYFLSNQVENWGRYVVTDCDVDLSIASRNSISVYNHMLDIFPDIECAGPMLRIADISKAYPLFKQVINRHVEQFWQKTPEWRETPFGRCAYIHALFDTTFAVHKEGQIFGRARKGVRLYEPFEARHLDWYPEASDLVSYGEKSSDEISHWANKKYILEHKNVDILFDKYNIVSYDENKKLKLVTKNVFD